MKNNQNLVSTIISSPVGKLGLSFIEGKLAAVKFMRPTSPVVIAKDAATKDVAAQLLAYFNDPQHLFKLPLHIEGTEFQKSVWAIMREIPSGETLSYQSVAQKLKTSPRAVGNACRRNPLPIVIPCHRVVAKNGIGGYSGETSGDLLNMKIWLLTHEGMAQDSAP